MTKATMIDWMLLTGRPKEGGESIFEIAEDWEREQRRFKAWWRGAKRAETLIAALVKDGMDVQEIADELNKRQIPLVKPVESEVKP
jgi:hypothetical protein